MQTFTLTDNHKEHPVLPERPRSQLFDLPEANFQDDDVTALSKDEGHAAKHKYALLIVMGNLI